MTLAGFLNNDQDIADIFDQDPELAFLEQVGKQNLPRNMQDFFRGQTSLVEINKALTAVGLSLRRLD